MNDRKRAVRYGISFVILAVLLIFLFIWNVNSGSIHLSVREILNIIFRHQGDETSYNIVWEIRLPRILAVIILGGALSVSGFFWYTPLLFCYPVLSFPAHRWKPAKELKRTLEFISVYAYRSAHPENHL